MNKSIQLIYEVHIQVSISERKTVIFMQKPNDKKNLNEIEIENNNNDIQETTTVEFDMTFINEFVERIQNMCREDIIFTNCLKTMGRNNLYFTQLHKTHATIKNSNTIAEIISKYTGDNVDRPLIRELLEMAIINTETINKINTLASIFE